MRKRTTAEFVIGIDLGKRRSRVCVLRDGVVDQEFVVSGTASAFRAALEKFPRCPVVMEVGLISPWVSRLVTSLGFESIVVAASSLKDLMGKRRRKNDRQDAQDLALLWCESPHRMTRVHHVDETMQRHRTLIQSRDALIRTRTLLVNTVRGLLNSRGIALPSCSTAAFPKRVCAAVPEKERAEIDLLLETIAHHTAKVRTLDAKIEALAAEHYPNVERLKQVAGVATLTGLAFMLTIGDPQRFVKNRAVGAYLGLVPKQQQSGDCDPQLSITKAGNGYLRHLLVNAAHYTLGPFGPDSDLRRFGLALCARGGCRAKKRAVIAVARRIAVLLLSLWKSGAVYEPLRNNKTEQSSATA